MQFDIIFTGYPKKKEDKLNDKDDVFALRAVALNVEGVPINECYHMCFNYVFANYEINFEHNFTTRQL